MILATAIDAGAGGVDRGFYNTCFDLSANAGFEVYNSVALGASASATNPLQVRIGNTLVNYIGGYQGWSTFSDVRYKTNVREDAPGIAFISRLHPVTYTLDVSAIRERLNEGGGKPLSILDKNAMEEKEKIVNTGFIAQEVDRTAKELGFNFSGVDQPRNENGFYALRYAQFVVPLTKAIQEQQQQIHNLNAVIGKLDEEISELYKRITT